MSRNILVCGLLVTGLAFAGCSSSSKSGTAGDGSLGGTDLAGQTARGDVPGGGTGGDAGAGSSSGNSDAKTEDDGSVRTGDGSSGGDVKSGQPGDLAGGAGGTSGGDGGPDVSRDAREAPDQAQPQKLFDGGPAIFDAPMERDAIQQGDGGAAIDSLRAPDRPFFPFGQDGPSKDTGYCNLPDYGLSMSTDARSVSETYDICQDDQGRPFTNLGLEALTGTLIFVTEATGCVVSGDTKQGQKTGRTYRMVLGVHGNDLTTSATSSTQRVYVLKIMSDGTEARAAYDLVAHRASSGTLSPYPDRYARLEIVCGDPAAFPEFDGWTGRIGLLSVSTDTMTVPGRMTTRYSQVLLGSAKGETAERAISLYAEITK